MRFVLRLLVNGAALWVAAQLVPGIIYNGNWLGLLVLALIFGLVNATLGSILRFLTCPLVLLTLGLFTVVINAALLMFSAGAAGAVGVPFSVNGCWPAILGALVISVVSFVLTLLLPDLDPKKAKKEAKKKRSKST